MPASSPNDVGDSPPYLARACLLRHRANATFRGGTATPRVAERHVGRPTERGAVCPMPRGACGPLPGVP